MCHYHINFLTLHLGSILALIMFLHECPITYDVGNITVRYLVSLGLCLFNIYNFTVLLSQVLYLIRTLQYIDSVPPNTTTWFY